MRTHLSVIATFVLAACGGGQSSPTTQSGQPSGSGAVLGVANADSAAPAAVAAGGAGAFANRKGELLNPDDSTIVFLYYDLAGKFRTRPWTVKLEGEIKNPQTVAIDDLMKWFPLEERVYRMRCVEAWSMVIPWVGFPLAELVKRVEPLAKARYVAFTGTLDMAQMPGQRRPVLDWPYVEGLRLDEALHPLTLLAVGLYGRVLPNQNGAPLRLVVPWKYGFKGIKGITKIRFVEKEPPTSWSRSAPDEYGFYANVNPEVDHPRWSQARERRIGEFLKRKTLPFNGYADQVAHLYAGMDPRKLY